MNEESEETWAKIQGDWNNPNYRRQVAKKGMCLGLLMNDVNRAVASEASRRYVDKMLAAIRKSNG